MIHLLSDEVPVKKRALCDKFCNMENKEDPNVHIYGIYDSYSPSNLKVKNKTNSYMKMDKVFTVTYDK